MLHSQPDALSIINSLRQQQGCLLPILRAFQQAYAYIDDDAVKLIASELNISRAEVIGTISFYSDLRREPRRAKPVVQICAAEACQAMGARALLKQAGADADFSVEEVYCLGLCALAPGALVGEQLIAQADMSKIHAALAPEPTEHAAAPSEAIQPGLKIYLSADSFAQAQGSEELAERLQQQYPGAEIIRTGSHGCAWLEPVIEIDAGGERVAFGNISLANCADLLKEGQANIGHSQYLGPSQQLPYWQQQKRLSFAHCGWVAPLDYSGWRAHGGGAGLQAALQMSAQQIVDAVKASGLRGRGGAGFPTGIKWQTVLDAAGAEKYIVVNADEGDSGTFADRMLIEGDPFSLLEGMVIAGLATGARRGFIYLRSEYPQCQQILTQALQLAESNGLFGTDLNSDGFSFSIELRMGAGAYICGEETSLLESLEGKRGVIRYKPPLPALQGLFAQPTVVNNVISIATVPAILAHGAEAHAQLGVAKSRGTLTVQLAGNIKRGGLYELPFGISLQAVVNDIGGGTRSGKPIRAVQVGGPLGAYLRADQLDIALDYETFAERGFMIGHGGIVVFDSDVDMAEQARFAMQFCAHESCGKCTPCRIGSIRGQELVESIQRGEKIEFHTQVLRELCDTMTHTSLCALGGMTPAPVLSALNSFPEDFGLIARV